MRDDIVEALGLADAPPTVGAVCVYPTMVAPAVKALEGTGIPVAAVATGFPAGLTPLPQRLDEIRMRWARAPREIDIVIKRAHRADAGLAGALRRGARRCARPAARRISRRSSPPAT